ncbi:MAG: isochorismatase [Deltaproteobacteria bacterium]|nr:isochorismatase [Deltaproteobacteria bacterium]
MRLREPYAPRVIRPLGIWREAGWRLKAYGIAYRGEQPRAELIAAAKIAASHRLPQLSAEQHCYGVGFLGVHDGRDANLVFVDWWANENELHHHAYVSPANKPELLEYVNPSGMMACVWDLQVIGFERQAWVETVLANPRGPDLEAYLSRCLSEQA